MASNWTAEEEEPQQLLTDSNPADYNQLWKEAQDVDEEVQRILLEHGANVDSLPEQQPVDEDQDDDM